MTKKKNPSELSISEGAGGNQSSRNLEEDFKMISEKVKPYFVYSLKKLDMLSKRLKTISVRTLKTECGRLDVDI